LAKPFAPLKDVPFHGLDAASEGFGNLLLRHLLYRKQNDRGSLLRGQTLQGVAEHAAHFGAFEPAKGIGSGGQALHSVGRLRRSREIVQCQGATCFATPPEIEGEVGNDPHEPAAKRLGLLQHRQIGEGLEESILRDLHRIVDIAEESICHGDGGPLISDK